MLDAAIKQASDWGWTQSEAGMWWLDGNRRTRVSSADGGLTWRATDRFLNPIRDEHGAEIGYLTEGAALVAAVEAGNYKT